MSAGQGGIWAVVPVKPFALAKQRLAPEFAPTFRRRLARAMLCDVLAAVGGARTLAGFAVITADPEAGQLAQHYGGRLLVEQHPAGLNPAVMAAAAVLAAQGCAGMLVVPGDIPTVTSAEIDALVALHAASPAVSLVPAHDGLGTNALLVSPPQAMNVCFGPLSLSRHRAGARALGIVPQVHDPARFPGFARDIDTPGDLRGFHSPSASSQTGRLLAAAGCS
ncbi:2-phospho-L-lactate guanylyltransferase [Ancylobacter sp.]|uniref:2-phospho-L-lactate guanylyltransferase n=1 Tax=Ancylobacter sp. TaxID=1872567 RepID=UPI003D0D3A12